MAIISALAAVGIPAFLSPAFAGDAPPKLRLSEVQDVLPVRYGAALTLLKDRPSVFGTELGDTLPMVGSHFCDVQSKFNLHAFFAPLAAKYDGIPRNLAQVEESIDRCVAIKNSQTAGVAAFLARY